ncbi:MAG: hypothetical protein HC828_11130 [Blastochloris sp.]|nr:hypothetical protein [Blastochloris sp.]
MFNPVTPMLIDQLVQLHGAENVSTAQSIIDLHAKDQSHHAHTRRK